MAMVERKKDFLRIQRSARLVEESKRHVQQLRQSILQVNTTLQKSLQSLEKSFQWLEEDSRLFEQLSQSARRTNSAGSTHDEFAPMREAFGQSALPPQPFKPIPGNPRAMADLEQNTASASA